MTGFGTEVLKNRSLIISQRWTSIVTHSKVHGSLRKMGWKEYEPEEELKEKIEYYVIVSSKIETFGHEDKLFK